MEKLEQRRRWSMPDVPIRRAMNELDEHNEVKLGDAYVVRIPRIEGKISQRTVGPHLTYVDYIWQTWYDTERKQMRNRKKVIGQVIECMPGIMLPNEQYYQYFDRETGEEKRKEEEPEMTKQQEMIHHVLEEEGMIRRDEKRIREAIRDMGETEQESAFGEKETGEAKTDNGEETPQAENAEEKARKKHVRILLDLMTSMRDVIKDQARKRPEDVVPSYQVEKINPVLDEIRKMEEKLGYGQMLDLIPEPKSRIMDGERVIEGMSYSDAEILMECYNSVIWFTQDALKNSDAGSQVLIPGRKRREGRK